MYIKHLAQGKCIVNSQTKNNVIMEWMPGLSIIRFCDDEKFYICII